VSPVISLVDWSLYSLPRCFWRLVLYSRMNLELNDVQAAVLTRELHTIIQNDRYPLSPRIVALREILEQLHPEPPRQPLPPRRRYEPPSKGRYSRRR
jgi:hypothetical protein